MITWRRKWQPTPVFMPRESHGQWSLEGYRLWGCKGFPGDSLVKNPPAMQEPREMWDQSLGWEDPLEKGMATHSSIYFGRVPWAEESGGLQSMGSHRVGHEWGDLVAERGKPVQVQRDKTGALGQEVQENSPAEPGLPSPLISVLLKPPSKCSCSPWRIHPLHPVCRSGTARGPFLIFPIPFFSWVELRLSQTLCFWVLTWNSTPFVDIMIRYCQHKSVCLTHSRPSTSKTSDPGAERVYCKGLQEMVAHTLKSPELPQGCQQSTFQSPVRQRFTRSVISSCIVLWLADDKAAGWCQRGSSRPGTLSSGLYLFHLFEEIFTSAKQLSKCASNAFDIFKSFSVMILC